MLPSMSCDLRVGVSESDVLVWKAGFEINFLRITEMDCDWLCLVRLPRLTSSIWRRFGAGSYVQVGSMLKFVIIAVVLIFIVIPLLGFALELAFITALISTFVNTAVP